MTKLRFEVDIETGTNEVESEQMVQYIIADIATIEEGLGTIFELGPDWSVDVHRVAERRPL